MEVRFPSYVFVLWCTLLHVFVQWMAEADRGVAGLTIRMRIMPTKSLGCWAVARTPASPTIPMAMPAARPERPPVRPAPRWPKAAKRVYWGTTGSVPVGSLTTKGGDCQSLARDHL